jgi:translation initiation factor IF-2
MAELAQRGVETKNHLAALNDQEEELAISAFKGTKPRAPRGAKSAAAKARPKPTAPSSAVATLEPVEERLSRIDAHLGELKKLSQDVAQLLERRKARLLGTRRVSHAPPRGREPVVSAAASATGVAPAPVLEVPVFPAGESMPPAALAEAPVAAEPGLVPSIEEIGVLPVATPGEAARVADDVSLPTEIAPGVEAPAVQVPGAPAEPAPPPEAKKLPPKKPHQTRKIVSMTDRLGGPKPVITRPATPLTRPPARVSDGRRRPVGAGAGKDRFAETTSRAPGETGGPPSGKPGARGRGVPKGKVRFFPKHQEEVWTDGPSPQQLRHYKPKTLDQRAEAKRPDRLEVALPITVKEFSAQSGIRQADIIKFFLMRKTVVNANSHLDEDNLETLSIAFNIEITFKKDIDLEAPLRQIEEIADREEDLVPRPPVVTLLGHVDHGKTSILDYIRKTNVHEREFGGITQHISAYRIDLPQYSLTFIDTPGHAAFTQMRARGARVTDIAILVVAADDGPMPQTEEAISHARAAEVGIVVALNKCDLPTANVDRTKHRLAELGVIPPEWGGTTEMVQVSALTGAGMDDLLEMLHLMGEVMGLKANPERDALGYVLEAKSSGGRGILVTTLVRTGTLRAGDYVLCGRAHGRIRGLWSTTTGEPLVEAGPSTPVEIMGLSEVPQAGDRLYVLRDEQLAVSIAEQRSTYFRETERAQREEKPTLENLFNRMKASEEKELRLVLKADVQGSVEPLVSGITALATEEVSVKILHAGVGMVTENDVVLADASNGIVIGFNVTVADRARAVSEERGIEIRNYNIIYELIDEVRAALEDRLSPIYEEVTRGHAAVRQLFRASKIGTIAGCMVTDGTVTRTEQIRVRRGDAVIHTGTIATLRREKDDAKEVREGFECGIKVANFDDIQEGDVIECFRMVAKRRTL